MSDCFVLYLLLTCMKKKTSGADKFTNNSMGTQPKDGFMDFVNYDDRTKVDGKMVWAELYYNRELTEKEMRDYDLVK